MAQRNSSAIPASRWTRRFERARANRAVHLRSPCSLDRGQAEYAAEDAGRRRSACGACSSRASSAERKTGDLRDPGTAAGRRRSPGWSERGIADRPPDAVADVGRLFAQSLARIEDEIFRDGRRALHHRISPKQLGDILFGKLRPLRRAARPPPASGRRARGCSRTWPRRASIRCRARCWNGASFPN